ncbi:hypothetical protein NDU88_001994 [Pleurodeles waltl]|uniref:Uncharacterized protein n=1 Tax=Pleurodeles waltl TaxID=8319 RepID=A0AAV7W1L6_PLEWA|nr:hypothetical protein NDU88_001994 [Pleurodeles waltl]
MPADPAQPGGGAWVGAPASAASAAAWAPVVVAEGIGFYTCARSILPRARSPGARGCSHDLPGDCYTACLCGPSRRPYRAAGCQVGASGRWGWGTPPAAGGPTHRGLD